MLRSGRFRHRLLDEVFLQNYGSQASVSLQPFIKLWKQGHLQDIEMVAIYIWIFSFLRRPQNFFGGPHANRLMFQCAPTYLTSRQAVGLLRTTLPGSLQSAKSLLRFENENTFFEHFCSHSWRSIPFSAVRALAEWALGHYPLKLMTDIPSPDEVLEMQTQGWRCVSMLIEECQIKNFVLEGRDVLGFLLHDLIHADHFFSDHDNALAQIHFSKKLRQVRHSDRVQEIIRNDPEFVDEFHYLMADMNTVPLHLLKSLKAIFLAHFKRRDFCPLGQSLSTKSELEFSTFFESILIPWNFSDQALQAVRRLNTPFYQAPEDSFILDRALRQN